MSYLKKVEWIVVPSNKPIVMRNCPKCNKKSEFLNTEKFRVNANKNLIDVWLIYQCKKCKSTWNMPIYERKNIKTINKEEYSKFILNDNNLAEIYGFNNEIHAKNKSELIIDTSEYYIQEKYLGEGKIIDTQEIKITCKYPIKLRTDKLIASQLNISRTKVKTLYEEGNIYFSENKKKVINSTIKDGMIIYIKG